MWHLVVSYDSCNADSCLRVCRWYEFLRWRCSHNLSLLHGSLLFLTQHFPSFSRFGPCLPPIVTLLVRSPSIGWDCYWLPTWHCVSSLPLRHSVVHDVILFHISGSRTHTDDNTALFYISLCYRTQDDWHCNAILYFPLGFIHFFFFLHCSASLRHFFQNSCRHRAKNFILSIARKKKTIERGRAWQYFPWKNETGTSSVRSTLKRLQKHQ